MIALGCDHGGLALKRHVMEYLDARGLAYHDFGCYTNESCDYPDFGRAAAEAVASGECDPLRPVQRAPVRRDDPAAQRRQHAGHGRRDDRKQHGRPDPGRLPQHGI